eukprot:scaffold2585_cov368-Prasinococcus_capsulatus_cf.AAC.11
MARSDLARRSPRCRSGWVLFERWQVHALPSAKGDPKACTRERRLKLLIELLPLLTLEVDGRMHASG